MAGTPTERTDRGDTLTIGRTLEDSMNADDFAPGVIVIRFLNPEFIVISHSKF